MTSLKVIDVLFCWEGLFQRHSRRLIWNNSSMSYVRLFEWGGNNRMCTGVEFPKMQLKFLFFKTIV